MIHFDFVVDEAEAETIFSALQDEIVHCYTRLIDENTPEQAAWFNSRIKFLENLKSKMKNSRV